MIIEDWPPVPFNGLHTRIPVQDPISTCSASFSCSNCQFKDSALKPDNNDMSPGPLLEGDRINQMRVRIGR